MALNKCETCGAMVSSKFEYCPNCGDKLNVSAPVLATKSSIASKQAMVSEMAEKSSVVLNIISFLSPIVGWILYFALKSPVKAKSCAKWAWIGFFVNLILFYFLMAL